MPLMRRLISSTDSFFDRLDEAKQNQLLTDVSQSQAPSVPEWNTAPKKTFFNCLLNSK